MDLNGLGMFEEWMVKEQQRSYWEGNQEGEKNTYINRNGRSQIGLEKCVCKKMDNKNFGQKKKKRRRRR